ncbi:MAG: heme-binding protein [Planctomycetota bacterium]
MPFRPNAFRTAFPTAATLPGLALLTALALPACAQSGADEEAEASADVAVEPAAAAEGKIDPNWAVREAKTPEGWPDPTPVGQVHLLRLPTYRAAVAERRPADADRGMNGAFGRLFRHIQAEDIPMTAPVEMTFDAPADDALGAPPIGRSAMTSMAFLYPSTEVGHTGPADSVKVVDVPAQDVVSIGVRGGMSGPRMTTAVQALEAWLDDHADTWKPTGEPRWLGYNSPMVPDWAKYAEVQMPVVRIDPGAASDNGDTAADNTPVDTPATQPAE